jgi:hypothetical protein
MGLSFHIVVGRSSASNATNSLERSTEKMVESLYNIDWYTYYAYAASSFTFAREIPDTITI